MLLLLFEISSLLGATCTTSPLPKFLRPPLLSICLASPTYDLARSIYSCAASTAAYSPASSSEIPLLYHFYCRLLVPPPISSWRPPCLSDCSSHSASMDFALSAQILDETLMFDALPSTSFRQVARIPSAIWRRIPNPLPHYYAYGLHITPPLHTESIGTEMVLADVGTYNYAELEQRIWDTNRVANQSNTSGLKRETISDYLARVACCSEFEEICTVCQDKVQLNTEMAKLCCDHIFHFGCIERWLMMKNECPVCRASVIPLNGRPC